MFICIYYTMCICSACGLFYFLMAAARVSLQGTRRQSKIIDNHREFKYFTLVPAMVEIFRMLI